MIYENLRQLADSWGLVLMAVSFLLFIGWTFRSGARERHHDAANMIFEDSFDEDRANG